MAKARVRARNQAIGQRHVRAHGTSHLHRQTFADDVVEMWDAAEAAVRKVVRRD
jgi:hypothetical protein